MRKWEIIKETHGPYLALLGPQLREKLVAPRSKLPSPALAVLKQKKNFTEAILIVQRPSSLGSITWSHR